jgi:hypothetical protein
MSKETFSQAMMKILNNIGRMFIYQLFHLPIENCSEFVLGLIEYQPNQETKKMLF